MDKWLSRLAHNQEIEGSTPSPVTNSSMSEKETHPPYPPYEILPIDPEKNPPETIEELEILIDKLQGKSASIKQQLEVIAIREKQGLAVDYSRVKRAMFARTQTNRSIAALQRIVKNKRQQAALKSGSPFEKFFFEVAKAKLSADMLTALMDDAFLKMREAERSNSD